MKAPVSVEDGVWMVTASVTEFAPSVHRDDRRRAETLPPSSSPGAACCARC
jgi:hypothetical protein